MLKARTVPFETTLLVRDTCLCFHTRRAARALARRFDEVAAPAWPEQRSILADDVLEPSRSPNNGLGCLAACDGSHDPHGRPKAAGARWSHQADRRSSRPAQSPHGVDPGGLRR